MADKSEFWTALQTYAQTVFDTGKYTCTINWWTHDDIPYPDPCFYIYRNAGGLRLLFSEHGGPGQIGTGDWSEEADLRVLVFAIEHRNETIEGIDTFEQYIQYCIYEVTGSGFVKSGNKT